MTKESDEVDGVAIRYGCKCGYFAPISSLFYSETCQKIVCRQPTCSVEEFESYYCGHLLVNMPSKEASMYQNRSSRCFSCVTCGNVLSTAFHDTLQRYFFLCAHCRWDSLELGLVEEDPDMLLMSAVARERESTQEDIFHTLLSHYTTAPAPRLNRTNSLASTRGLSFGRTTPSQSLADSMKELQREQQMKKFRLHRMTEMGNWKYEDALAKADEKELWLANQRKEHEWTDLKKQLEKYSHYSLDANANNTQDLIVQICRESNMDEVSTMNQRFSTPLEQPRDATRLFPSRPRLRVKKTWRCVESIERGSAGILVKPQISPMSGDSSLPVPVAWFKKANLAIHYLPIITFQEVPARLEDSERMDCILLVENPLDDGIRIVFRPVVVPSDGNDPRSCASCAEAWIEDFTPISVGPYEDPNIADAFSDENLNTNDGGNARNTMLIHSVRNLVRIKLPIKISTFAPSIAVRIIMEMEKFDEERNEVIDNSALSVPVEFFVRF